MDPISTENKRPNKTTRQTFDDTDAGRNLIRCKDADDMFKKLKIPVKPEEAR